MLTFEKVALPHFLVCSLFNSVKSLHLPCLSNVVVYWKKEWKERTWTATTADLRGEQEAWVCCRQRTCKQYKFQTSTVGQGQHQCICRKDPSKFCYFERAIQLSSWHQIILSQSETLKKAFLFGTAIIAGAEFHRIQWYMQQEDDWLQGCGEFSSARIFVVAFADHSPWWLEFKSKMNAFSISYWVFLPCT